MRRFLLLLCFALAMLAAPVARAEQSALLATGPQDAVPLVPAPSDDDAGYGFTTQEVLTGAAVVGGALLIGMATTGSLVSGLTAASAVLVIYSLMP